MKHGSASIGLMPPPSDDEVLSTTPEQRQPGRRRSVSVADSSPSVETVMSKAKRAALSLWMLLHAQNCVLGQKCPHTGCQEATLLHLHLKTCHAVGDAHCPLHYHGCDQSRKLLAHYRRCRQLRLASSKSDHHCLVCALVARQARTSALKPRKQTSVRTTKQVTYAAGDSLSRLYGIAKQLDHTTFRQRARSKSEGDMLKSSSPLKSCDTIVEEAEILDAGGGKLGELADST